MCYYIFRYPCTVLSPTLSHIHSLSLSLSLSLSPPLSLSLSISLSLSLTLSLSSSLSFSLQLPLPPSPSIEIPPPSYHLPTHPHFTLSLTLTCTPHLYLHSLISISHDVFLSIFSFLLSHSRASTWGSRVREGVRVRTVPFPSLSNYSPYTPWAYRYIRRLLISWVYSWYVVLFYFIFVLRRSG